MKSFQDPRHQQRIGKMQALFSYGFQFEKVDEKFTTDDGEEVDIAPIVEKLEEIDKLIVELAPEWPIERLNRIDLAILRLSIFEMMFEKQTPSKVVIDEAVELSKEFGGESTPKFVNGVLGTWLKNTGEEVVVDNSTELLESN